MKYTGSTYQLGRELGISRGQSINVAATPSELAAVEDWAGAWTMLVDACAIARTSGDYCAAENIREAVGRYHVELAAGRTAALYARQLGQWVAYATR